jgi:hypothetical protein
VKDIPLTSTNTLKLKPWHQWLKMRATVDEYHRLHHHLPGEEGHRQRLPLECPDHRTIVFKTGGGMWDHPPNKAFRSILSAKEADRDAALTQAQKGKVVSDILQEARDLGFDFWRWDKETGWYIRFDLEGRNAKEEEALLRNSIYVALRDHLKRVKARRQSQSRMESTLLKKRPPVDGPAQAATKPTKRVATAPDVRSGITHLRNDGEDRNEPSSSSLWHPSYSTCSEQNCGLFGTNKAQGQTKGSFL